MNRNVMLMAAVITVSLALALQMSCSGSAPAVALDDSSFVGDLQDPAAQQGSLEALLPPVNVQETEEDDNHDESTDTAPETGAQTPEDTADGGPAADAGQPAGDAEDAEEELSYEEWYLLENGVLPGDNIGDPLETEEDEGGDGGDVWDIGSSAIEGTNGTSITDDGQWRYITASGLPDHETGSNGNTMSAQDYSFRMPLYPVASAAPVDYELPNPFGIAINGVLFDPYAAEFWNNDFNSGWQIEPMPDGLGLDDSHGHVQPGGAYHYHGLPWGMLGELDGNGHSGLVGFAADGFPIYALYSHSDAWDSASAIVELESSYRLKAGLRPDGPGGVYDGTYCEDYEYIAGYGDLDECNGRYGVTPQFPQGTYYYVITRDWPYIPRMFRAEPDNSFDKGPGGMR